MSNSSYYTNAGNFMSAVQGSVDPRTGLFNVHLPLANTQANLLMGPTLSLALLYSPLSTVNNGFGIGFRLNLSQYNKNTRQLLLSNGEEYRVGNNDQVRQQKLKNFIFKKLDENTYQVIYKSGLIECLSLYNNELYVPEQIASADGRRLRLLWDSAFSPARLKEVIDDDGTVLCSVTYPNSTSANTAFTLLPGMTNLSRKMTFTLMNDRLKKVTNDDAPEQVWSFDYDDVGPQGNYRAITAVHSATGLIERVSYYTQAEDSMAFPDIANLPPLPCVHRHTLIPGGGQPQSVTTWTYTRKNYLGKDAPLNQWHPDDDSMLNIFLMDYEYGSTEQQLDRNDNVLCEVTRRYNSYHLLASEETVRDGKKHRKETEYYAMSGRKFDDQPAQYALPKTQTESWSALNEKGVISSRSTVTSYQFDEFGNPVRQETPDGTISEYTYYPAEGEDSDCPADPHGFTRYIKNQTVTSPKKNGDEPISITRYTWQKLAALTGNGYAVVQKTVEQTTGNKRSLTNNTYYSDKSFPTLYGRINRQDVTLTPDVNRKENFTSGEIFTYSIGKASNQILECRKFIGYDGLTAEKTTVKHMWYGKVMLKTTPQGVETRYCYDTLGRVTRRTLCANSEYENTTTWEYGINKDRPHSIETDASGNKNKTFFDGAGRVINQLRFDAETTKWYETFSCAHNSLGEVATGTVKDYLPAGNSNNYPLTSNITYGGWGEKKEVGFSDGRKTLQQTDPIGLTQTVYSQGGDITSGRITTTLDKKSQLPLNKVLKDTTGDKYSEYTYHWDGLGQLREENDELGHITKRTYDEYGRVLTQTLADGTIVSRTYAAHLTGNYVTSISVTGPDANGTSKTWALGTQTFDSLGRVTKRVSGGRTTSYSYQGASPVPSTITLPSGKTVEYTYIPELGNAINSMKADGIVQTFNYDKKTGQPLTADEASAKIQNTWSKAGQLKEEAFSHNAQNRKAKHTYTLKGAPVTYTDVAGKQTQYSMDAHGRVTSITDDSLTVSLRYDGLGRLSKYTVRSKGNSSDSYLTTELSYDAFGREITRTIKDNHSMTLELSQTWQKNGLLNKRTTKKNGTQLREEQYGYDSRNRLISYTASGSSLPSDAYGHLMTGQNYTYDALNNFTAVFTWLSDGRSNRAKYSYENSSDPTQLTKVTNSHLEYPANIILTYDAEGRMTRDEAGRTLTYDVMGRLTSVSDDKTHRSGTYSYDALNRLISRNASNNDTRELYYRGAELVNEVTASTNKETRLIKTGHTCLGVSDDKGLTLTAGDKNDSLLWSEDTGTSNEGELHAWSPYGSGKPSDRLPGFNGERVDPVSGTYHLGNGYRAYNPVLMRFNCPDNLSPFGAGGINPYAYCAGDPINHTDPSGHLSWQAITGIVAGAIGLGLAVFTAGSSIAAAGGVMAAISSASASSLIIGGLGVASDITAIASGAMEDSNPEASATLGWVSLATGLAGLATGFGMRGINKSLGVRSGAYRDRFFPLKRSGENCFNLEKVTTETINPYIRRGMNDTWYRIDTGNGNSIFGANRAIRDNDIDELVTYGITGPAHTPISGTGRPILVLTGVHGDSYGFNWLRTHFSFNESRESIFRVPLINDERFAVSDRLFYSGNRRTIRGVNVFTKDIRDTSLDGYKEILNSNQYDIVLGFCYGRNDEALRHMFDLPPVTSYVRN